MVVKRIELKEKKSSVESSTIISTAKQSTAHERKNIMEFFPVLINAHCTTFN